MSPNSVEFCGLTEPLFISATLKPAPKKQLLIKDTSRQPNTFLLEQEQLFIKPFFRTDHFQIKYFNFIYIYGLSFFYFIFLILLNLI